MKTHWLVKTQIYAAKHIENLVSTTKTTSWIMVVQINIVRLVQPVNYRRKAMLSWQNTTVATLTAKFKFFAQSVQLASGFRCFEQRSRLYRAGVLGIEG